MSIQALPSKAPQQSETMTEKKRSGRFLTILGILLLTMGLGLTLFAIFLPQEAEKIAGEARIATGQAVMKAQGKKHPTVRLGVRGGKPELNRCDGTFIEMASYETEGLQPVYAAHNNCKGEVVLPLKLGEKIKVKDRGMYRITDIRYTKKTWSTTDEILDMDGELILQSCFYGENRMKFIAITPVDQPESPAEAPTSTPSPN